MKKIILSFLLILTVSFLSGCSSNKDELFEKKQECLNYKNDIENKLQKESSGISKLDVIFYSESKNSCLYSYYYSGKNGNKYGYIVDYLTSENIFISDLSKSDKEFKNKIKELKGE